MKQENHLSNYARDEFLLPGRIVKLNAFWHLHGLTPQGDSFAPAKEKFRKK